MPLTTERFPAGRPATKLATCCTKSSSVQPLKSRAGSRLMPNLSSKSEPI